MLLWLRSRRARLVMRPKVPSLMRDTRFLLRSISERCALDVEKKWGWTSSKRFWLRSRVWRAGRVKAVAATV